MNKKKESSVEVRLSLEEKQTLKNKAKGYDLTMSAYIRKCALDYTLTSKTDIQMVFELKKIGVNLNQLAKHVNSLPVEENIKDSLFLLENYIHELKELTNKLI